MAKAVREILHETALQAPSSSGVYLWRNRQGDVIYVGKAKNLKNRLTSYFSGSKDIKTKLLVAHADSIEYITTANEYEAFLLENNLIKKHNPRYNIDLKDGKSYPVLRITNEDFPRVIKRGASSKTARPISDLTPTRVRSTRLSTRSTASTPCAGAKRLKNAMPPASTTTSVDATPPAAKKFPAKPIPNTSAKSQAFLREKETTP